MTETCGMTAITTPEFWQVGSVGVLGPSTELKLIGIFYPSSTADLQTNRNWDTFPPILLHRARSGSEVLTYSWGTSPPALVADDQILQAARVDKGESHR